MILKEMLCMPHSQSTTKKRTFQHLTAYQRGKIQILLEQRVPKTQIARQVGIARSTLYKELQRGTVEQKRSDLTVYRKYFAETGQLLYQKNRQSCRKPYKLDKAQAFLQHLEKCIQKDHLSPDAICGRAKREHQFPVTLCTKTVYTYIDLELLSIRNIDLLLKVRRNTKKQRQRKNLRVLGTSIEQRPESINTRESFGHWEIDTMVGTCGSGKVLLTLDERMTRKRHIVKIASKTTAAVTAALHSLRSVYGSLFPQVFKSITSDNGSEFSGLSETLPEVAVYFAHPYSSWERGTNEKQNSLVRRFIPKGRKIDSVSEYTIQKAEDFINNLPRKMFNYRTPKELFLEQLSHLVPTV